VPLFWHPPVPPEEVEHELHPDISIFYRAHASKSN